MTKIQLTYTHDNTVAHILLNDGKGNVLDKIMMSDLLDCFAEFKQKKNLKLITFQGGGQHFSYGASVEEHTKPNAAMMISTFHRLFYSLMELSIPTVANVTGQCLGGGMELALMCSVLFADQTAVMGQPEINLGVFPPPSSIILPSKIGLAQAEELLITGRSIRATEAHHLGLVNHVYEDRDTLLSGCRDWIEHYIVPKSASSLRYAVQAARCKYNDSLKTYLPQLEHIYINSLMNTNDANEGITAFLEKRKPVWTND